jgi:hypothetical protein
MTMRAGVNDAAKQRVLHVAAAALEQAVQQPAVEHARLGMCASGMPWAQSTQICRRIVQAALRGD